MRHLSPALALLVATMACGCAVSSPSVALQGPELGYVEWILGRPWRLGDLPAVSASFDEVCVRADRGDAGARELIAQIGPALWLVRSMLLPVLRALPGEEAVPGESETTGTCVAPPVPEIEVAVREFADPELREQAVKRLLAAEMQGSMEGIGDEARLARVVLAVTLLFPLDALTSESPTLAAAVATLDPEHHLLVPAAAAGGVCLSDAASPRCLWERLVVQALADATGAEALDRDTLEPAALDALARHGLLNLVARNILPVVEDARSNLRLLAAELVERLGSALRVKDETGSQLPVGSEGQFR